MKNHLEFWSEHPAISTFWLIVRTVTALAGAISISYGVLTVACDWIYWKGSGTKKFLNRVKQKLDPSFKKCLIIDKSEKL